MDDIKLIINLDKYRSSKSPVFAGRERGFEVRKKITEEKLNSANIIKFEIPDDVYAISSSFLLGLLGETIRFHQKKQDDIFKIIQIPEGFQRTFEETIREAKQVEKLI